MKKLFYLFNICALMAMPFAFISCGDDDDENDLFTPAKAVSDLSFTDTDVVEGLIGGTLTWTLPDPETNIVDYVIYLGGNETEKKTKLGEVTKGVKSFNIPAGTAHQPYLLVVARNAIGESGNIASLAVTDNFGDPVEPSTKRGLYILNAGNESENNASLSYYNYETGELTTEVYKKANGKGLGDSAEQLLIYGSKMYITVTGSNRIAVLDKEAKEIKSITPDGNEPMNPRCMVADNGKVYVSYFYGHSVAVLDTATLSVEKIIPVGRYPEQLVVSNGNIYVANSGGLDFGTGYAKTVSVIDLQSLTVTKDIEVIINPSKLAADSQGDIYVISMGNYGDIKNTLQRIDGQTNEVTTMGNASYMQLVDDELYTLYAQWDDANITYKKYDATTESLISESFIQDGGSLSPSNSPIFAVNPANKQMVVVEGPYGSTSSLHLFTSEGKADGKAIDTGGYYAKWVTFVSE